MLSTTNKYLFIGLQIIAWIIFVGLCIEAGAMLVNFVVSIINPAFVKNLYQKLDMSDMYNKSHWAFYSMYSYILSIAILKAVMFYWVILLATKIDLRQPFNSVVAQRIAQIAYFTLAIGLLSYVGRQTAKNMQHHGYVVDNLNQFWADSQAFILMAAVIYIIAVIFKRGVEIQSENDLTV